MAGFGTELLLMLILILVAAEVFTNALEHLGERLGISEGVTGSLFAAVGTALPETMVPVLAIVAGTNNQTTNEEIGVGAILGAPLMLSTLTMFLMSVAAVKSRGMCGRIVPEPSGFIRDMNFFLLAFMVAAGAMFVPPEHTYIRYVLSVLLVLIYMLYIILTFRASGKLVESGHSTEADKAMFFNRLGMKDSNLTVILQLITGLLMLVLGAKGFINGIEGLSHIINISPLILSLLIIPIATELPEKVNSIIWVRRRKDTLAVGNITGAMVFQGTLLPALGILLTPWNPSKEVLTGIIITLIAGFWLRLNASTQGIRIAALFVCGGLYTAYLLIALKGF